MSTEREFLSDDELRDLTDKSQRRAQAEVLAALGLPFREVGRRIIVSREHARAWLRGDAVKPTRQPDFEAIR